MVKEEGLYNIKRVDALPKRGNGNLLYSIKGPEEMRFLYRWLAIGEYEKIPVGGGVEFVDLYGANGIIDGGVIHLGGPNYYVWATSYIVSSVYYNEPVDGVVTLSDADDTFDRFDVFVINNDGNGNASVGVLEGQADDVTPIKPSINLLTQVEVSFRLVEAGETEPSEVSNDLIYNENTGAPTEWNNTLSGGNPGYSADAYFGLLSYNVPLPANLRFETPAPVSYDTTTKLVFAIKLTQAILKNARVRISLGNTSSLSSFITLNQNNGAQYNFNNTLINVWQLVSIDLSEFNNLPATLSKIEVRAEATPTIRLDWILLQGGISGGGSGEYVQSVTAGTGIIVDNTDPLNPIVSATGSSSGLEAINEGNGIGWRFIGRNAANYGNIGLNAIDLSYSSSASSTRGSTGARTLTSGNNNINAEINGFAFGSSNTLNANGSGFGNSIVGGDTNINYGFSYNNLLFGWSNVLGTNGAAQLSSVTYNSIVLGRGNNIYGAKDGSYLGTGLLAGSAGLHIVGVANKDLKYATATSAGGSIDGYKPRFIVGTGTVNYSTPFSALTRANGLIVMSDGFVTAPELTISKIDNPTVPQIATGTTDGSTTPNKLIHSAGAFTTNVNIAVGDIVENTTTPATTTITAVDSATTLSLADDIMSTGENYIIYPKGFKDRALITKEYGDANYGNVSKVGTPVNNQIGVWTGDGTIEGDANLTWDGADFTVSDGATESFGFGSWGFYQQADIGVNTYVEFTNTYGFAFWNGGGPNSYFKNDILLMYDTVGADDTHGDLSISRNGLKLHNSNPNGGVVLSTTGRVSASNSEIYVYLPRLDGETLATVESNGVYRTKVTLTPTQVKNLGTTPITAIAAPGAGKVIKVISAFARLTWNSVAYDNNNLNLIVNGATTVFFVDSFLDSTATNLKRMGANTVTDNDIVENAAITIGGTDSGATGDSTVDVYITYEIITL